MSAHVIISVAADASCSFNVCLLYPIPTPYISPSFSESYFVVSLRLFPGVYDDRTYYNRDFSASCYPMLILLAMLLSMLVRMRSPLFDCMASSDIVTNGMATTFAY